MCTSPCTTNSAPHGKQIEKGVNRCFNITDASVNVGAAVAVEVAGVDGAAVAADLAADVA